MADKELEVLYECAEVLSGAGKDAGQHSDKYRVIMAGVKGSNPAKRLASQFVARFFKQFPELSSEALDAILDLCEDDDVNIRKQAIKDLPSLCREVKEFLPKIADVLCQLLETDDASEITVIQYSLMNILRRDSKGTLIGLFSQVRNGGDVVRDRVLKFLFLKIKTEGSSLLGKEAEAQLVKEIKNSLEDCTSEEFHLFLTVLGMTNVPKSPGGAAQIAEIVVAMAHLDKPFDATVAEDVDRLVQCAHEILPYLTPGKSTKFCSYICDQVLPVFHSITDLEAQAQLLKALAEMAATTGAVDNPLTATKNIYDRLTDFMPLPPVNPEEGTNSEEGVTEAAAGDAEPEFEFTKVECLLFTYHAVGRQAPQHLVGDEAAEATLKDFKARLPYFHRANAGYTKKLKEFLANKTNSELALDENRLKSVALRCTSNINALIRDLFRSPPAYKAKLALSWKPVKDANPDGGATKRKSIHFDEKRSAAVRPKVPRPASARGGGGGGSGRNLYAPPTGKYSERAGAYSESGGGGGRGGYRGRGRGRGGYRGGY